MAEKVTRTRLRSDGENPPLPLQGRGPARSAVEGLPSPRGPSTTLRVVPLPRKSGGGFRLPDRLPRLLPVGEERFQAAVGERVLEQLADDRWRRRHHIGADQRGLQDVD